MAVYDCFPMFNELDLLEMRMEILDKHVDYFVIQECNKTFQGNDKPLYYLENKDRFKKFEHKIIHSVFIDDMGDKWNNWDRDKNHKNYINNALKDCNENDIIMLSDVDEIPNPNVLTDILHKRFENGKLYVMTEQDYCCYYINAIIKNIPWPGTRICNWSLLKENSFDELRNTNNAFWKNNPEKIILIKRSEYNESLGWHYTNLGGYEKIIYKLESYGHQELNNDYIKGSLMGRLQSLSDFIGRPGFDAEKYTLTQSNCSEYLLNNYSKYRHLLIGDLA